MNAREKEIRTLLLQRLCFFRERLPSATATEMELACLAWLDGSILMANTTEDKLILIALMQEPFEEMICTGQDLLKVELHNL